MILSKSEEEEVNIIEIYWALLVKKPGSRGERPLSISNWKTICFESTLGNGAVTIDL